MKLFITYNNFEGEEYTLWDVALDKAKAVSSFKRSHMPFFATGAQPPSSRLCLIEAEVNEEESQLLYANFQNPSYEEDKLSQLLKKLEVSSTMITQIIGEA